MSDDTVWIPSVPLPYLGWRTDRCGSCGKRFRGKNRGAAYELHYRREHERPTDKSAGTLMAVRRSEAERIYAEVRAVPPKEEKQP